MTFCKSSFQELSEFQDRNIIAKETILAKPELKPITINVAKTLTLISNFELNPTKSKSSHPSSMTKASGQVTRKAAPHVKELKKKLPPASSRPKKSAHAPVDKRPIQSRNHGEKRNS